MKRILARILLTPSKRTIETDWMYVAKWARWPKLYEEAEITCMPSGRKFAGYVSNIDAEIRKIKVMIDLSEEAL